MHFDWYAATLPASVNHCHNSIINHFSGSFIPEKPQRPYKQAVRHKEGGFRVYHGGPNPHPFFVASGEVAEIGRDFVREFYPIHRVARADVAFDFREEGGFERMVQIIEPIARKSGAAVTFLGDPEPGQKAGRTMYFGSWKSDVQLKVYEKGLERRAKGVPDAPEDWIRVELKTQPRKERKSLAATMDEDQLWGLSKWTKATLEKLDGTVVEYQPDRSMRKSTADRAVAHMLKQYAGPMRAFVQEHSVEVLLDRIRDVLAAQ